MEDECIHAILIEPQLDCFRERCGLRNIPLTATFEGWHRHAIVSPDRVFLFPRDRSRVAGLLREATVLEALAGRGVPAPQLRGQWRDPGISPYPFIAVSRLPGKTWSRLEGTATFDQLTTVLAGLGQAIAAWHRLDRHGLPRLLRDRYLQRLRSFEHFVDVGRLQEAARTAARLLGLPARRATAWLQELEPVLTMQSVCVHGDINEGQILVDDNLAVTGILDWETAGAGHPLKDFDFGEWGYGIFAWEQHFDVLRKQMWKAYARARGGELPSWQAVHRFFCLISILQFQHEKDPDTWGGARLVNSLDLLKRLDDEARRSSRDAS